MTSYNYKIVAIVPARAGSKRVPGKNTRNFMGQSLISWSIKAALKSSLVTTVIVSTDDEQVKTIAGKHNVTAFDRPAKLANDKAVLDDVIENIDSQIVNKPDGYALLQPTSPLRYPNTIDDAIKKLFSGPDADRLIEVSSLKIFSGRVIEGLWHPDFSENTRSQELPQIWFPTGGLYVYKRSYFEKRNLQPAVTKVSEIPEGRVVNIDYEQDFTRAEEVFKRFENDYAYLLA